MGESTRNLFLIGIDEAGRGPLAGPVVVAGIKCRAGSEGLFKGIKDSKKLSFGQREEWFLHLTNNPHIEWVAVKVWPATIDRINIYQATLLGAKRVCSKLCSKLSLEQYRVLLDGSLYLSKKISQKTIIKGDELVPIISAASVIAKVVRDRTMFRLHKKYPQYRFDLHKGYATRLHCKLLKTLGYSQIHRFSFKVAKS